MAGASEVAVGYDQEPVNKAWAYLAEGILARVFVNILLLFFKGAMYSLFLADILLLRRVRSQ